MKFCYPAIFSPSSDGSIRVRFPDLEGCAVTGRDTDEAMDAAKEAEINWITLELDEGGDLPPMSDPADLRAQVDAAAGETLRNVAVNIRFMEGYDE